ncbi:NTP transferase domain-containing protein [Dyella sp. C9]|uniref:nucleotidyltransferase family protein n=1 Tax=Dyella sp. C9 TaxID=2202154 RepID=UPI000DEF58C6|nr:nucleotidyltransferase family protein [Dyella sp. C9]
MTTAGIRTGAVILAAGEARRYGALKQLIAIDGEPMVRRVASNALAAGLLPVVVVVGAQRERVIACLHDLDVHVADNPDWPRGMGSSLATGVRALQSFAPRLESLMVLLADQPAIQAEHLQRLLATHAASPERILACRHHGDFAPPCVFPLSYAGELVTLDGAAGARALLERHAASVDGFKLASAFLDIDTPADLDAWLAERNAPSRRERS